MPAIVLVEPFDPVNVAAIARVMASFRAGPLIIARPIFDPKHLNQTNIAAIARGGTPILDAIETVADLGELRSRYDTLIATSGKPSSGSHTRTYLTPFELRERGTEGSAIVFGSESDGLRVTDIDACDLVVSIETAPQQRALNLSHAVAAILAITQRIDEPVQKRHPQSTRDEKDALLETVTRLYTKSASENSAYRDERLETHLRVWKRVIARSDATKQEVRTLFGLLDQCERALKRHGSETTTERSEPEDPHR